MSGKDHLIKKRDPKVFGKQVTIELLDVSVPLRDLDFVTLARRVRLTQMDASAGFPAILADIQANLADSLAPGAFPAEFPAISASRQLPLSEFLSTYDAAVTFVPLSAGLPGADVANMVTFDASASFPEVLGANQPSVAGSPPSSDQSASFPAFIAGMQDSLAETLATLDGSATFPPFLAVAVSGNSATLVVLSASASYPSLGASLQPSLEGTLGPLDAQANMVALAANRQSALSALLSDLDAAAAHPAISATRQPNLIAALAAMDASALFPAIGAANGGAGPAFVATWAAIHDSPIIENPGGADYASPQTVAGIPDNHPEWDAQFYPDKVTWDYQNTELGRTCIRQEAHTFGTDHLIARTIPKLGLNIGDKLEIRCSMMFEVNTGGSDTTFLHIPDGPSLRWKQTTGQLKGLSSVGAELNYELEEIFAYQGRPFTVWLELERVLAAGNAEDVRLKMYFREGFSAIRPATPFWDEWDRGYVLVTDGAEPAAIWFTGSRGAHKQIFELEVKQELNGVVATGANPRTWAELAGLDPYRALVVEHEAVSHYRFDEASGDAMVDAEELQDGSYVGAKTLQQAGVLAGSIGSSVNLNGGYGVVPYRVEWGRMERTMIVHFKVGVSSETQNILRQDFGAGGGRVFLLSAGSDGILSAMAIWGSYASISSVGRVDDGQWHQAVFCWASGVGNASLSLYLDGALVGSALVEGAPPVTTEQLLVGAYWSNGIPVKFLYGEVDELSIYPYKMTDEQVAAHYAAITATNTPDPQTWIEMDAESNVLTGASAALSLEQLGNYTGPVVQLRRISDNALAGFTSEELTDGTALAWLAGTYCKISGYYNQVDGQLVGITDTGKGSILINSSGELNTRRGRLVLNPHDTANDAIFLMSETITARQVLMVMSDDTGSNKGILNDSNDGDCDLFIGGSVVSFDGGGTRAGSYAFGRSNDYLNYGENPAWNGGFDARMLYNFRWGSSAITANRIISARSSVATLENVNAIIVYPEHLTDEQHRNFTYELSTQFDTAIK